VRQESPARAALPEGGKQTISYLTRRFADTGFRPGTRHGQNFLIDLNLQRLIVDRAGVDQHDVVLEVGTGTGALTGMIAERAAAVVTVEIDPRLFQLAGEELCHAPNVVMLNMDALRNKSHFDERVIEAVALQLAAGPNRRLKLVANLPYSVATPVIANLLASPIVPHSMTVTVQKEVADRIMAQPGSKDYGALSVWIASQCRVELVRTLAPSVFWPRPQVTSAIVHIEVDPERRREIGDLDHFHDFVRRLFWHRRKFLRSVLASALKGEADKQAVDEILAAGGFDAECRAEQLDIAQILALSRHVRQAMGRAFGKNALGR
jgi:16S rRNA (adenine1518-N6/adenine1519-N6)-dimethyltransferase